MLNDLGKVFLDKIQEIREESGGKMEIHNIDSIVASFMETIKGHVSSQSEMNLYQEIEQIAKQVKSAKQEVAAVRPDKISNDYIPGATLELSAVTKDTENATNTILDAAEQIQNVAMGLDNQEANQAICDPVIRIFEACNFQDLTGQRINKVIGTLEDIETRVMSLIKAFSSDANNTTGGQSHKRFSEKELLNGPQLQGHAPSQDQIDDLFNSL